MIDSDGNIVVSGTTDSRDFPEALVFGPRGRHDAFILKLNPTGEPLLWCRMPDDFLQIHDLALTGDNSVVLAGGTTTALFSATSGVFQSAPGGGYDAFVTRLRPPEWQFEWFSYLGGLRDEQAFGLALDPQDN